MIIKDHLWIGDEYKEVFDCASLATFGNFYSNDLGLLIRREPEKSIHYFKVDHEERIFGFYIKRESLSFFAHFKFFLKNLKLRGLQTEHEFDLIRLYQRLEVAVVEPVVLGRRTLFGVPICGFLVQKEVVGHELVDLMKGGSPEERLKLLKAYGKLVGELHSKGLVTSIVRVTDLICVSSVDVPWEDIRLIVIDREKGPIEVEQFSSDKGTNVLASMLIRFFIYIDRPSAVEVKCFLVSYLKYLNVPEKVFFKEMFIGVKEQFEVLYRKYKSHIDPVYQKSICQ